MSTEATGLDIEGVLAAERCRDVHPERSVTCHACRSWGAHVAAAVHAHLAEWLGSGEVVLAVANAAHRAPTATAPTEAGSKIVAKAALNAVAEALGVR